MPLRTNNPIIAPSLDFQKKVQENITKNSTQPTFVRREPIVVSQTDNTRTNTVDNAKRDLESYTQEERAYFAQNNIPRDKWFSAKAKMQNDAILKKREEVLKQAQADVKNNPFAITPATNEQLRNEFRLFPNDPNSFFDEYLNPAKMIGDMAANIGDNFTSDQPINPWKLATDVITPAFAGMTAGIGTQNTGQFANNLINPLAGISNPFKKGFKSEIDWSKWNKEIPENKVLMKEYNAVEQQTKANGTWMKNPDGSPFKGTPEQFVQQNSINFRKAYPEGVETGYRGAHQHIEDFKNKDNKHWATFMSDDFETAKDYANTKKIVPFYNPQIHKKDEWVDGIQHLAFPKGIPKVVGNAEGRGWRELNWDDKIAEGVESKLIVKGHQDFLQAVGIFNKNQLSTDIYANYIKNKNNPEAVAEIKNVVDRMGYHKSPIPSTVYAVDTQRVPIKSLRHNNGMFDMTNPNIYKTLFPAAVGAGSVLNNYRNSYTTSQKMEDGGEIKNNNQVEMSKTLPPTNINYEMIAEFQRIMNETKQVIEKEKENTQVEDAKSKLMERQNAINFIKELKLNYTSFKPGQERRVYENGGETSNYFSDGGDVNPPIFTSNRNDPRLQSYNDSLNLYNKSKTYLKQPYSNNLYNYAQELVRFGYSKKIAPGKSKVGVSGLMIPQYKKPVQPVTYKKEETIPTPVPTVTPIETTPTPKVERKVVSVTPEEVKAGTKTTSGKQIGSGTAGGRVYKVSYDNGETEILNEYEYRSRGLKMENGGEIKKYKFKTKQK